MEHRLCYGAAENNRLDKPGATPVVGSVLTPKEGRKIESKERERILRKLMEDAPEAEIQRVLNNTEECAKRIRTFEENLGIRLEVTTAIFRDDLEPARRTLEDWDATNTSKTVLKMIDELQKDLPKKGGKTHRYGTTAGITFNQIRDDQAFIDGILTANVPKETEVALLKVKEALGYLGEQDINHVVWKSQQDRKHNKADKAIDKAGQMVFVIAALMAGVATGVPAIAKMISEKKLDFKDVIAPLLCFGIAIPIANPHVRRYFVGAEKNAGIDLDVSIRNPKFRQLCRDYEIQGEGWGSFFDQSFKHPEKMQSLANKFRSGYARPSEEDLQKEIDAYVNHMSLGEAEEAQLTRMIKDGRFTDLSDILSKVMTKEGQGVIVEYVGMGARKYEDKAYAVKQALLGQNAVEGKGG